MLDLIDCDAYYDGLGKPKPNGEASILEDLEQERLVSADVGGRWNILNLGAILFAKDIGAIDDRLARKSVRFVMYDGTGRDAQVLQRKDFPPGYATGFVAMNDYISTVVPSPEQGGIVRNATPLFPVVAVRSRARQRRNASVPATSRPYCCTSAARRCETENCASASASRAPMRRKSPTSFVRH